MISQYHISVIPLIETTQNKPKIVYFPQAFLYYETGYFTSICLFHRNSREPIHLMYYGNAFNELFLMFPVIWVDMLTDKSLIINTGNL